MNLSTFVTNPPEAPSQDATPEAITAAAAAYREALTCAAVDILWSGLSLQEWAIQAPHEREAFVAAGLRIAAVKAQLMAYGLHGGNPLALVDKDAADLEKLQRAMAKEAAP